MRAKDISRALRAFLAAGVAVATGPVAALDVAEVRLGVLSHDVVFTGRSHLAFPDPFSHRRERGVNLSLELTFTSPSVLGLVGSPRPRLGGSLNTAGDTSDVHADLAWRYELRAGPFAEAFFGGAWHDGALRDADPNHAQLGSRFLFHVGLETGWRVREDQDLSVQWEHLSNGSFASPNQGIDRLGVRWGLRFQ